MAFEVNDDHWAFLNDFEAPMWADLGLEANSNVHDIDDKWFYTTHEFHRCSSSHLKSVFSHGGDESTAQDSDLLGPSSSPSLPRSVSKSRGKQYRSKKWKGIDNGGIPFDKGHPVKVLTGKSLWAKPGPGDKVRHKSTSSSGIASSSEGNPTSTVTTSESGQEQQLQQLKAVDVSSQAFGQTNGLLSMMKKCLRKSYITRQAARVEVINNDGRQSRGSNSTSSNKSSVGSSSNQRCDIRVSLSTSMSVRSKEITPDSTNMARTSYAATGRTKKIEEGASNNRRAQVNNNTAKQKVQYRDSRTEALVSSRVNGPNSTVALMELKKKTGMGTSRKSAGNGKENVIGKTSVTRKKCNVSSSDTGGDLRVTDRDQKVIKQSLNAAGTICSKGKGRGIRGNLEKPKSSIQRPHFR